MLSNKLTNYTDKPLKRKSVKPALPRKMWGMPKGACGIVASFRNRKSSFGEIYAKDLKIELEKVIVNSKQKYNVKRHYIFRSLCWQNRKFSALNRTFTFHERIFTGRSPTVRERRKILKVNIPPLLTRGLPVKNFPSCRRLPNPHLTC